MKVLFRWLPAIVISVLIFIASSLTGAQVQQTGVTKDIYQINGHFIFYLLLCLSYYKGMKNVWFAMALSFIFGVAMEFYQLSVPGRSFQIKDIITNGLGIILGGIFVWKLLPTLPMKLKSLLQK